MVAAVQHFDAFLITHSFTVETDHRALIFLNSGQQANGHLARWALKLQPFSFRIQYRPGSSNGNADAFSRMIQEEGEPPGCPVSREEGEML